LAGLTVTGPDNLYPTPSVQQRFAARSISSSPRFGGQESDSQGDSDKFDHATPTATSSTPEDKASSGAKKGKTSTEATENASPDADPKATKPNAQGKKGFFSLSHSTRQGLGILFEDIIPPLLGFSFIAGGPVGWGLTIASWPLSYASGKLGRHVSKSVDSTQVNGHVQNLKKLSNAFKGADNGDQVIDQWNHCINDVIDAGPKGLQGMLRFVGGKFLTNRNGWLGRVINTKQFFNARINSDIAHANSLAQAGKAGVKGGFVFALQYKVLPAIGRFVDKMANGAPGPLKWPFKGLAKLLENYPYFSLAKDVFMAPKPSPSK
jgi:hypothetical protein